MLADGICGQASGGRAGSTRRRALHTHRVRQPARFDTPAACKLTAPARLNALHRHLDGSACSQHESRKRKHALRVMLLDTNLRPVL